MSIKGSIYKFIIRTVGKNSAGLELARSCGLNSAEMMDYIYRKVPAPRGKGVLGLWADKIFLNFPTWESIRKRKRNLQNILYYILKGRFDREPEKEIKILDLASGYGQYIFPVLDLLENKSSKIYVEMRDKNATCEDHIKNINRDRYNIKFVQSDITKESDYDLNNKFDIIILTGFYDSIAMNEAKTIEHTMQLAKKIMNEDALFIFSYQASHVDASLVNELFNDTNDVPLSMGERSKIDIKYIMNDAGLKNIGQIADSEGRYPIVVSAKQDAKVDFIEKVLVKKDKN